MTNADEWGGEAGGSPGLMLYQGLKGYKPSTAPSPFILTDGQHDTATRTMDGMVFLRVGILEPNNMDSRQKTRS